MKSKSSPSPEERSGTKGLASAIGISLFSMLLYVNTLNHQFVYDDRYLTRDNPSKYCDNMSVSQAPPLVNGNPNIC